MDFIKGPPMSKENCAIVAIVDRLIIYVYFGVEIWYQRTGGSLSL